MAILEEPSKGQPTLATSREPVAAKSADGKPGTLGMIALNDAVILVILAWVVLFALYFSLRSYNV